MLVAAPLCAVVAGLACLACPAFAQSTPREPLERTLPAFWKSRVDDVEDSIRQVKRGDASVLARTPGGRTVHLVAYGERENRRGTANYNSAAGGVDPASYARKDGTQKLCGGEPGEVDAVNSPAAVARPHLQRQLQPTHDPSACAGNRRAPSADRLVAGSD